MKEHVPGARRDLATFRFVMGLFVLLLVAFVVGQWFTISVNRSERSDRIAELNRINEEQCTALNRQRLIHLEDKQSQLRETKKFLREHPQGISGISRVLIVRQIARTKGQIAQLRKPACPVGAAIKP